MDAILQTVFSYAYEIEKFCILIKISLKFVPKHAKGPIDNKPSLFQIMGCRQAIIWTNDGIYASLGLNELIIGYPLVSVVLPENGKQTVWNGCLIIARIWYSLLILLSKLNIFIWMIQ